MVVSLYSCVADVKFHWPIFGISWCMHVLIMIESWYIGDIVNIWKLQVWLGKLPGLQWTIWCWDHLLTRILVSGVLPSVWLSALINSREQRLLRGKQLSRWNHSKDADSLTPSETPWDTSIAYTTRHLATLHVKFQLTCPTWLTRTSWLKCRPSKLFPCLC